MSPTTYAWAPITKVEQQDDGTVMVYGPAADAGLDRDGQRLNQAWLDKAMPVWMAEGGNVREQHDPMKAAGVGVGLTRADNGAQMLVAHIVDPVTVAKINAKVLRGFSIGVKGPHVTVGKVDAPNGEIVGGFICEVSVCDRPSNPRTLLTIAKADSAGALEPVEGAQLVEHVDQAVIAQAVQVLAELAELVPAEQLAAPAVAKADTADIAAAGDAIAAIARLIQSEAQDLAAGDLTEVCEIGCLLDAVRALKYFIAEEQDEDTPAADVAASDDDDGEQVADDYSMAGDVILMADEPDTTKTDKADTTKADGGKALTKSEFASMLDGAVAKVTEAYEGRLSSVEAQLTKAMAAPAPGGPVQTRTAAPVAGSPVNDRRVQANALLVKANAVARDDASLAAGYREQAQTLLAKADA